jgi:glycosyltransferase involved in cell wall biosynthesis
MIERGRVQAARFSWESTARQVLEIYREAAAER